MRQVIVYKTQQGDWIAICPSLPGCRARAADKPTALDAIKRAVDEYVMELKAHHAPIPKDTAEIAVVLV